LQQAAGHEPEGGFRHLGAKAHGAFLFGIGNRPADRVEATAKGHEGGARMNSSMISKIEKAHRYAQEPDRIKFQELSATFHGGHDDYTVKMTGDHWSCTCHTFETHAIGTCSHIMALQEILKSMLTSEARFAMEPVGTGT